MSDDYTRLPADLPAPEDDGAADHLLGIQLPRITLPSSRGGPIDVSTLGDLAVVYVYPRTGTPGEPLPTGWNDIPGARGCTPQACAYRDALADFEALGASVIGIGAQSPDEQRELAEREHIPFPLLSDADLRLRDTLRLPTFEVDGMTLYRRLTLIAETGRIAKVFYPVFPPDRDAAEVLGWLAETR
ncbi:MAG: peroxiredoxin [Chloroflexota bacterium]